MAISFKTLICVLGASALLATAPRAAYAVALLPTAQGTVADGSDDAPPDGVVDGVFTPQKLLPGLTDNGSIPSDNFEQRGILEYDLSTISGYVTTAFLDMPLTGYAGATGAFTVDILVYTGDGDVTAADYFAGSFLLATPYDSAECCDPTTEHLIDVTTAVRALVDASAGFAGFNVQRPSLRRLDDRGTSIAQYSTSFIGTQSAMLLIETGEAPPTNAPEPGTLALLLAGFAGLGLRRRR